MTNTAVTAAFVIRSICPNLTPSEALNAARFMLTSSADELSRYVSNGFTTSPFHLRVMAELYAQSRRLAA